MQPTIIKGKDPKIIKLKSLLLFLESNSSTLKKRIIAINDPKWRLISIRRELDLNSYKVDIKIK